jgi:DNA-binding SARP family transcriptional activator
MTGIRVLGPIEVEVDGRLVDLGGPRQRAVLAMLVAARRGVVSTDRLIEDLWRGTPPPSATASLQAYVSKLRRVLEPSRSPRTPARLLVSAPPGYALRVADEQVDAWRFEGLLRQARELGGPGAADARVVLEEALGLWQGPAFAEVGDEPWAATEAARLEQLRLGAAELLVAAMLGTGAAAEAVAAAEVLVGQQPLREEGWRLLALGLWASGRQADALAALRRARGQLVAELGLDPGPRLVELEGAILGQRMEVLAEAVGQAPAPAPAGPDPQAGAPAAGTAPPGEVFVGRQAELAALAATAGAVRGGGSRVVLVTGEAGVGKSSLLARMGRALESDGWLVVVGRCPEAEGAPPAWAWVESLRSLAGRVPPGELAGPLAPLLEEDRPPEVVPTDAAAGRFRLRRAVCAWLRVAAGSRPLAIVLDDLHNADAETLALLAGVAEELPAAPILAVAAFRPTDADDRLEETLAVLARRAPHRWPSPGCRRRRWASSSAPSTSSR